MFGIGMPELLVILVVALIVLGPQRLPEVARTIGKAMGELRRATSGITEELQSTRSLIEEEGRNLQRETRALSREPAGGEPKPEAAAGEKTEKAASAPPADTESREA